MHKPRELVSGTIQAGSQESVVVQFPKTLAPLVEPFRSAFTRPTFDRFGLLLLAAILTPGRRTVTHVLATVPWLMRGHLSSYHRVLSQRRWSL